MPILHYGAELSVTLDDSATKGVIEAIASHASRGGWVSAKDHDGHTWWFLVTAGIPIWISERQ